MYVAGNPRDQELVDEAQIWTNATSAILVSAIRFIDILSSLAFSKHWQKMYASARVKDAFLVWRMMVREETRRLEQTMCRRIDVICRFFVDTVRRSGTCPPVYSTVNNCKVRRARCQNFPPR